MRTTFLHYDTHTRRTVSGPKQIETNLCTLAFPLRPHKPPLFIAMSTGSSLARYFTFRCEINRSMSVYVCMYAYMYNIVLPTAARIYTHIVCTPVGVGRVKSLY